MGHDPTGPSWQSRPCPPWCVRTHREDDHPDDRFHDSRSTRVPVVLLDRDVDAGPGRWSHDLTDLAIVVSQHDTADEVVVLVGREDDTRQQLHLSAESAARLAKALDTHLRILRPPG